MTQLYLNGSRQKVEVEMAGGILRGTMINIELEDIACSCCYGG